jgi:hypothetical protein
VYRYFSGYTLPSGTSPDDGTPGMARIAKRFQTCYQNQTVQVDVSEAWAIHWENGEVKPHLDEIRVHFTSNHEDPKSNLNNTVFDLFFPSQTTPKRLEHRAVFDAAHMPENKHNAVRVKLPDSCVDCHIGLMADDRSQELARWHYPPRANEAPKAYENRLDDILHLGFMKDVFLPDVFYTQPPSTHFGLKEFLDSAPLPTGMSKTQAAAQFKTLDAFRLPSDLLSDLKHPS